MVKILEGYDKRGRLELGGKKKPAEEAG